MDDQPFLANWLNACVWVRPIICLSCQFPVFLSNSLDLAGRPARPKEHFPFPHATLGRKGRVEEGGVAVEMEVVVGV